MARRRRNLPLARRRRIKTAKNQATIEETLARYAGRLTGVYPKGSLRTLRREWR